MKTKLIALLVSLALPLASAFAGEATAAAADRPIVVGVSVPSLGTSLFESIADGAEQAAAKLGVKVVVADAHWDLSTQVGDIEGFVAAGVQGIVISPIPFGSLVPAIEAAVKAGIPVATVSSRANTDKVLVHVGVEDAATGRAAAKFIIDRLGNKGSLIELDGPPGFNPEKKAAFDKVMKKSNVKVLVSQGSGFSRDEVGIVMASLVQKYPGFDAVYAANDDIVLGAIDAMSPVHIDPASKVTVGQDALPEAFQYIKEGKLSATIDQFPRKQGGQALEYLIAYVKNKTKPSKQVVLIAPELVTKVPSSVKGEVRFPVRDSLELSARLYRPEGGGSFPAVVLMHGCSGLWWGSGGVHRTARYLRDSGYVVLIVDSLTARNVSTVCDDPTNKSPTSSERVDDALAARRYLSSLAFVDSRRIGLVGWSHGGITALITWISRNSVESDTAPFAAIAAYYPYCFDADVRSASGPFLILIGERDDWCPATLCQSLVARATALGRDASVTVYPGATHAFDCVEGGKSVEFLGHRMAPDLAAERNSHELLLGFLDKALKKQ